MFRFDGGLDWKRKGGFGFGFGHWTRRSGEFLVFVNLSLTVTLSANGPQRSEISNRNEGIFVRRPCCFCLFAYLRPLLFIISYFTQIFIMFCSSTFNLIFFHFSFFIFLKEGLNLD